MIMTAEFPDDARITLAHGAGGRQTAALIARVFARHFQNPDFTADDAAILPVGNFATGRAAFTTDGFIVSPWQFPGGNIGKLSICGTVNDLACMGAVPRYLSCAFQIEEGFPLRDLDAIAAAMAETAAKAGVRIVAGDTKVAGRGQVDGVFITTTGIGELLPGAEPSGSRSRRRHHRHGRCRSPRSRHPRRAPRLRHRRRHHERLRAACRHCQGPVRGLPRQSGHPHDTRCHARRRRHRAARDRR